MAERHLTATDAAALRGALAVALGPVLGAPVTITEMTAIKGGYSRQMWAVDAIGSANDEKALVLCLDAVDSVVGGGDHVLDRPQEGCLLHALHAQGLSVPDALCWGDADGAFGRPYLVMERVSGTAAVGPLRRMDADPVRRRRFGRQMAEILATVHAATVPPDLLDSDEAGGHAQETLRHWGDQLRETPTARTPTVAQALDWLDAHLPPPPNRLVLVHGDFRTGNLLHDDTGFRWVLDWEMAHLGDPLEDVAWATLACWGMGTGRVGSLLERTEWVEAYERASGRLVDEPSLRFWEVLGAVKMTVLLCRAIAKTGASAERDLLLRLSGELDQDLSRQLAR